MNNSTQIGAYSAFSSTIDDNAKMAFQEAFQDFSGVDYEPIAVSTQIVSGTNFYFFCNATMAYPGSSSYPAMVGIFQSLDGRADVTHIERVTR